jgi:hypothetical protein
MKKVEGGVEQGRNGLRGFTDLHLAVRIERLVRRDLELAQLRRGNRPVLRRRIVLVRPRRPAPKNETIASAGEEGEAINRTGGFFVHWQQRTRTTHL